MATTDGDGPVPDSGRSEPGTPESSSTHSAALRASEKQVSLLRRLLGERELPTDVTVAADQVGDLSRRQASDLIDILLNQPKAVRPVKRSPRGKVPSTPAGEDVQRLSDKQLSLLRRLLGERELPPDVGVAADQVVELSRRQASDLIDVLLNQRKDPSKTLRRTAGEGNPGALGAITWFLLKRGRYAEAVAIGDEAMPACREFVASCTDWRRSTWDHELANAVSNLALCRLALGEPLEQAMEAWRHGVQFGHVESMFYPAVIALRRGDAAEAQTIASVPSGAVAVEFADSMRESAAESVGWFADWCRDGLVVVAMRDERNSGSDALDAVLAEMELPVPRLVRDQRALAREATHTSILETLSHAANPEVRIAVADNAVTSSVTLGRLSHDSNSSVRAAVARHPSTPPGCLEALARDRDPGTRAAAAGNRSTPQSTVETLARDPDSTVRKRALINPSLPNEIRSASGLVFAFNASKFVTSGNHLAVRTSANPIVQDVATACQVTDSGTAVDWMLFRNAGLVYQDWGGDPESWTVSVLFVGREAPDWWSDTSIIGDWLGSKLCQNLARFSRAPALPGWTLEADLWNHLHELLRLSIAPASSAAVMERLAVAVLDEDLLAPALGGPDVKSVKRLLSAAIARHPNTPAPSLARLAASDDDRLRWLVSRNPSAPNDARASAALVPQRNDWRVYGDLTDVLIHTENQIELNAAAWTESEFSDVIMSEQGDSGRTAPGSANVLFDSRANPSDQALDQEDLEWTLAFLRWDLTVDLGYVMDSYEVLDYRDSADE